jgi:hypothetical protein
VIEAEVQAALSSMKKGKSLGLGRFTVEFFLVFYDLMKADLLKVVRESQRSRKILGSLNSTFITLIPKKKDGLSFGDLRPI